jgi:hypothetical protein
MKFTRDFDRARFLVLVLDPFLITHSIDVVIGEYIHKLHFRVERDEMVPPTTIDMDDEPMDDREEEGLGGGNNAKSVQQENSANTNSAANNSACGVGGSSKHASYGKSVLVVVLVIEELHDAGHDASADGDEILAGDETSFAVLSPPVMQVVLLATILETKSPVRRSKRRAETVDESSLERVERIKAARNLDFQGNTELSQPPSFLASDEEVIHNLGFVGISLGLDSCSVSSLTTL